MSFSKLPFAVATSDGRTCRLLEEISYTDRHGRVFILPIGAETDGASSPALLWPTLPPFGAYWPAAVLHDLAYRNTLLEATSRLPANLTKQQSDDLFIESMIALGVPGRIAWELHEGVHLFGWKSFEDDRSLTVPV